MKHLDCDDCLERLHPYLDRELSDKELDEVRVHLDDCEGCESSFVLESVFLERLRGSATADICPEEVRKRLILRIREGSRRPL
jgi:mycothiol system anti-sigma-R factor